MLAEESPGMGRTNLLLSGTSANTGCVVFKPRTEHWLLRESALRAAFKSSSSREILRPAGLRMTGFGDIGSGSQASDGRALGIQ